MDEFEAMTEAEQNDMQWLAYLAEVEAAMREDDGDA